jgi:hypothetical protein
MYTTDVELALDTGRPLGIRESDFDVEWPVEIDDDVRAQIFCRLTLSRLSLLIKWHLKRPLVRHESHF